MPIYEFSCPLCGQRNEEFFGMNDAKRLKCLNCGSEMERIYSLPALTGDARMTRNWDYYDVGLGQHVTSKADRDRKMRAAGLQEAQVDPKMQPYVSEVQRIHKSSSRGDREAKAAINDVAREAGRVRRDAIVEAELAPAFESMKKEAGSYDGPVE